MFYRVFASQDNAVEPAQTLEHLQRQGLEPTAKFRGDQQGWFHADFLLAGEDESVVLERYLSTEEGIRAELNTWAAWLESVPDNPHQARLMQHMIATRQVFTLYQPPEQEKDDPAEKLCLTLCRFLAQKTAGVYQVDGQGFFSAQGVLLVREE